MEINAVFHCSRENVVRRILITISIEDKLSPPEHPDTFKISFLTTGGFSFRIQKNGWRHGLMSKLRKKLDRIHIQTGSKIQGSDPKFKSHTSEYYRAMDTIAAPLKKNISSLHAAIKHPVSIEICSHCGWSAQTVHSRVSGPLAVGRVLWYGVILGGIKLRKDAAGREETVHKCDGTSAGTFIRGYAQTAYWACAVYMLEGSVPQTGTQKQGLHQVRVNLKSVKTKSTKVNSMCLRFGFEMPTQPSTSCEGLTAWREPVIHCRKRVLILGGAISHQILVRARFGAGRYNCRTELGRRRLNATVQVDFESGRWMLPRSVPDSTADGYNHRKKLGQRRLNATAQVDFESGGSMLPRSVPDSTAGGYNRRTKLGRRRLNATAQVDFESGSSMLPRSVPDSTAGASGNRFLADRASAS
ncbi:hypothetical protein C8J57DRAFT_1231223 [Mycena rebaudengoi]|nr:hypothetical protein C8J57DRAFT_1231223 [Mycena rebaudengoi]